MKRTLTITALVVAALALTSCTSKDPTPDVAMATEAPARAPTVTTPADPLQTSPDEARHAYLNYVDAYNEVGLAGYKDWMTILLPLATGDEMGLLYTRAGSLADQGYRTVGSVMVKSGPTVVEYEDTDPLGNFRAEMTACLDTSGVKWVAEGRDALRPEPDGRFYYAIAMRRIVNYDNSGNARDDPHGQGWWRVDAEHGDPEKPC
ncbi:MAG: hypothetical protein FWF02_11500 [Micrococcales bacterium]|nr:hypothetical protein [Micrococcales bacterium]MCL2668311.1 hypothetical protein [Micrococcales bacterium]